MADILPPTDYLALASMTWAAFGWIIGIVILVVVIFMIVKHFKDKKDYNKKGLLIRRYGGSIVVLEDVFKFVFDKKRNIRFYYGKKSKAEIPADKFDEMMKSSQNKDLLFIDNYAYGEYRLMGISENEMAPLPVADKKSWYIYSQKDNLSRFNILDFLEKYAVLIGLLGLIIVLMISFIFQGALWDKMNAGLAMQNSYAQSLQASTDNIKVANEVLYQVLDKGVNLTLLLRNMKIINGTAVIVR